jgi:hypothetical protein
MKAHFFLNEVKPENLIAIVVNLEVIPRGIYQLDDKKYYYSGTPTFIIKNDFSSLYSLMQVEIVLEEYTGQDVNGARR